MGVVSTIGSALGSIMNTQAGAAIAGGLTNMVGQGLTKAINKAITSGSSSSAVQGSAQSQTSTEMQGWQNMQQQGGATETVTQQGSVQGIANALATALGTATGNNAGSAAAFNQQSAQTANNLQNQQWIGANIMNLTSNVMANLANAASQSSAKRYNAEQSKIEREWAQMMRSTAYQDTMKDMKAAGLNPILAANNGATGNYSGAEGSISSQGYQQAGAINAPSAHTASMQAMYDYGNNTAQFVDNMLQTINNAKQTGNTQVANWLTSALTEGAATSAKTIESYAEQGSGSYKDSSSSSSSTSSSNESRSSSVKGEAHVSMGKGSSENNWSSDKWG